MSDNYERLFQNLKRFEPSKKLRGCILARIYFKRKRSAAMRLAFSALAAVASLVAVIPSFQYAAREFSQSGFYRYFSLIFSDSGAVVASWREFALSLIETLPITEVAIFLATIFVFLISARLTAKNICAAGNYKFKLI